MTQLLRILASLSIIAVTVVTVDLLFGKMADSQFMEKPGIQTQYELTSLRDIDILIVGSSRARRHYDTPYISEQLSCRAYNVGYDAIGITFYLAMIKSILDKTEPRLLIVDALAHEFSGELNDRINNLNPYIALNHKIMDVAIEIDPIKRYTLRSSLVRYNSSLLDMWNLQWRKSYDPSSLGFCLDDRIGPENFPKVEVATPQNVDPVASHCMEEIAEICRERGIDLIVLTSPDYFVRNDPSPVGPFCAEHNIKFFDFSKLRFDGLDEYEYFLDFQHLNSRGARLYTQYLLDKLPEMADTCCRDLFERR